MALSQPIHSYVFGCPKSYTGTKCQYLNALLMPDLGQYTLGKIDPSFIFRVAVLPASASKGRRRGFPFRVLSGNNLYSYLSVSARGGPTIRNNEDLTPPR